MSEALHEGTAVRSIRRGGVSYIRKDDLIRWLEDVVRDLRCTGHDREASAVAEAVAQIRRVR